VCQSREDLFEAAAQFVIQSLPFQTDSGKTYSVAFSGGSTPQRLFARLAAVPYRSQVDWSSVRIFWGDEREVPPDHSESNFRMAKENLLDRVPIPPDQVFRMEEERPAQEAAVRYEEVLQRAFSNKDKEGVPRFDLTLLGMGADGHRASLFPETSVLQEEGTLGSGTLGGKISHSPYHANPECGQTCIVCGRRFGQGQGC